MTLNGVQIPDGLFWINEFSEPTVKSSSKRTLTGSVIVQSGVLNKGRLINLSHRDNSTIITRLELVALKTLEASNITMVLVLHNGDNINVRFMPNGLSAELILLKHNPADDDLYKNLKLNLISV